MPKTQDLPGQLNALIEKIRAQEDETLRRDMVGDLLIIARSNKKRFNKARKAGKPWAEKLISLCREVGVEV